MQTEEKNKETRTKRKCQQKCFHSCYYIIDHTSTENYVDCGRCKKVKAILRFDGGDHVGVVVDGCTFEEVLTKVADGKCPEGGIVL